MGCVNGSQSATVPIEGVNGTRGYRRASDLTDTRMATNGLNISESVIEAYQRIDVEILNLETLGPGPRLATLTAWIQHLETLYASTLNMLEISPIVEDEENLNLVDFEGMDNQIKDDYNKIYQLALKLDIATNKEKARQNEEFILSASKSIMDLTNRYLREEILRHARLRVKELTSSLDRLRNLYSEHDGLLASATNGSYASKLEQNLDKELDSAKHLHDRLISVAEQWRTSATLLQTSAKSAFKAVEYWSHVGMAGDPSEKIRLALDCRSTIHGCLEAHSTAQLALPTVDIPFVTPRQITAVKHANMYLLTDMADKERYNHTRTVLDTYKDNINKSVDWLHKIYGNTISKHLSEAESSMHTMAKYLREERLRFLNSTIGKNPYIQR